MRNRQIQEISERNKSSQPTANAEPEPRVSLEYIMNEITIRLIKDGEEEDTFSMVERGFNAFVRDDFSDEGVQEFYRAIRYMILKHPPGHFTLVAKSSDRIVGMITVRNNFHISIFFVDPPEMNKGVGRALLEHAVSLCRKKKTDLTEIEVHSSPWAAQVYRRLGFVPDGPEQKNNGIRYTRMTMALT